MTQFTKKGTYALKRHGPLVVSQPQCDEPLQLFTLSTFFNGGSPHITQVLLPAIRRLSSGSVIRRRSIRGQAGLRHPPWNLPCRYNRQHDE